MKHFLFIPVLLCLSACATFDAQVTALKTDLTALVSNPTSAAAQAAVSQDVTNITSDVQTAYNSLSGVATVYQAYVGSGLPVPASVASAAASITKVGSAVQSVLSKVAATQAVANGLFQAAAKLAPSTAVRGVDPLNFASSVHSAHVSTRFDAGPC